ncbi:MAG: hypothetical protein AMJ94_00135 [Deltaproteobacteria bacterium SM23_61]|nr:MAG: hypothetical protein AMJ94_00135 [Deltaproteobacteria bacterium SM23_61]
MDILNSQVELDSLPKLGRVDVKKLWEPFPLEKINCSFPLLDPYLQRHDEWTEKIRIIGLDGGILIDYRVLPGLDHLVEYLYSQSGWARPEAYVVSGLGRKGIDSWSAVSVLSKTKPVLLLGTDLVENLDIVELAFVIGHETGHLLGYTGEWRKEISLSFLIREFVEGSREQELAAFLPGFPWREIYQRIMSNCRTMEVRCDRLGLILCGDWRRAASALLATSFKSAGLARNIDLQKYLSVQIPLLSTSPAAGPISVNAGHPFVPFRIKSLLDFVNSGDFDYLTRLFKQ